MDASRIPIGRFATLTRLTTRAIRHYGDLGLLPPRYVDPATGYRYYSPSQLADASVIALLRSLDMPLDDIRELLATDDRAPLLERHRKRLEQRLHDAGRKLDPRRAGQAGGV